MHEVWSVGMTLNDAEKVIIERTLNFYEGNKAMTARSLGVSAKGLNNKIKRYGIGNEAETQADQDREVVRG